MRQDQYAIENGGGIIHNFLKSFWNLKKCRNQKLNRKAGE